MLVEVVVVVFVSSLQVSVCLCVVVVVVVVVFWSSLQGSARLWPTHQVSLQLASTLSSCSSSSSSICRRCRCHYASVCLCVVVVVVVVVFLSSLQGSARLWPTHQVSLQSASTLSVAVPWPMVCQSLVVESVTLPFLH